jgi:hypothetical protein
MRTLAAALAVALLVRGLTSSYASQSPHLGSSGAAIARAWKPAPSNGKLCAKGIQGLSLCEYSAGRIHIDVGYKSAVAYDFIAWNFPRPGGSAAWRLLVSLLPAGAKRISCRTIKKTGGAYGPARACTYRAGKHQDLVAEYPAPTDPQTQGETVQDEGFDWIAAAN